MRPYRNKTTPCMGFFFCVPLGDHTLEEEAHLEADDDRPMEMTWRMKDE